MSMSCIFFKSTFEDYADDQILLQLIILIANNQLLLHFDRCIQTDFFSALLCGFSINYIISPFDIVVLVDLQSVFLLGKN